MTKRGCFNCIYASWSFQMKMSCFTPGFPCGPLCANHPDTPGRLREVRPGGICRHWHPKPADPTGDIEHILLEDGQCAIVDAADYEWLKQWTWHLIGRYAGRRENGKVIFMHREIVKAPAGVPVDHTDRNPLNNCRTNLRICTNQENLHNRGKFCGSYSCFKGVGYLKDRHKWFAKAYFDRLPVWLGYFPDEIAAAHAYDRKAVELFGEFAYLNFPEEWPAEQRQQVYAAAQPLRDALKAKAEAKKQGKSKKAKGKKAQLRAKRPAPSTRKHPTRKT